MTITTCQKVTLISCSVLCVSLFLPRMLLPRGKKEKGHPEVGPGFYPPVMHQLSGQEDPDQWDVDLSPSLTHTVEAMAKVKSIGRGKKYNLMAQVIPIYGFGILLYIIYIIYKLTCKGKTNKSGNHSTVTNANMSNTINCAATDCELARLQERLLQTEMMMERIVSEKAHFSSSGRRRKSKSSISKKEEKLLKQLRQITMLMQEGRLDGASPEMEAEEVPYSADWEGYPEETYPEYDVPHDKCGFETIKQLEELPSQPTAEALAESMEQEEEEIAGRKLSILQEEDEEEENREEDEDDEDEEEEEEVEEIEEGMEEEEEEEDEEEEEEEAEKKHLLSLPLSTAERKQERVGLEVSEELQRPNRGKKKITFSDQKHVFHYPREETFEEDEGKEEEVEEEDEETEVEEEEDEEEGEAEEEEEDDDDPLMEAESLQFGSEGSSNPEEEAEEDKEDFMLTSVPVEGGGHIHVGTPKEVGVSGLRMRNRRET
ncbi:protein RIC-3 [Melanotaenia boesemani]|uniref:protein RIC-3 n=1 Tax=Melanotaenia boesemani TaxID=1250792 RepID=UPI001C03CAF0|nr:protein RIC-3 [Melanotaenia boesemani]